MKLLSVALQDFRNFEMLKVSCSEGVNTICGENGLGKTSLLEAIWLCVTGQSFRTAHLKHLVHHKKEQAKVILHFSTHDVEQSLQVELNGSKKSIRLNGGSINSSALVGTLLGVTITPDDLAFIKGTPGNRRQFFDLFIGQIDPLYIHHFKRYHKALKQRNTLLKNEELSHLLAFEEEMNISGSYLIDKRRETIEFLTPFCQQYIEHLSSGTLVPTYASNTPKETLLETWKNERPAACKTGFTLHGPHRDDFSLLYNGLDLKHMGSEGEKKCGIVTLKLASWQMMETKCHTKPLLLIDDLSAHLDKKKTEKLTDFLHNFGQVFISLTEGSGNVLLPERS